MVLEHSTDIMIRLLGEPCKLLVTVVMQKGSAINSSLRPWVLNYVYQGTTSMPQ